jgi:pimeloyl-ACP methyl ester carboxylesterase
MSETDRTAPLRRPRRAASTPFPQGDVEVRGLRLRYVDVRAPDEEGPPLLLIHGHSSRIEEYDDLVPALRERRRVLVVDLPGSGYSDKPDRPYTLGLYEDVLLGFLDAMAIREAHVGGGSLGGNLTLRLGYRVPDRFPRLAAWAPAGAWRPMRGWARFGSTMRALGRTPVGTWLFFASLWVQSRFWYSHDWPGREQALRSAWAYYREVYGAGFHRMYWDIGVDQAKASLFDIAPAIRQPTWLAVGDRDHALGMFEGVKALAARLPDATLEVFPDARHSLANERASELGARVSRFLRREETERG